MGWTHRTNAWTYNYYNRMRPYVNIYFLRHNIQKTNRMPIIPCAHNDLLIGYIY